jgi:hypothetical protein
MRNEHKILIGKPKGKRSLRRHGHRLEDNIKEDVKDVEREGGD